MNRRIVTAAVSLLVLAACGGMEEVEGGDADFGTAQLAMSAAMGPVASTQDPVPARESGSTTTQAMVVTGAAGTPIIVVVSASAPADPTDAVSSTQDPIPAKIRNEAKPNPDGTGSPTGPR